MGNLIILKVKITYGINVDDAYNMVFGLNTKLKFYFNDGKQMEVQRLSKGSRFSNEIVVQQIDEEEKLDLISAYMNTTEFKNFEAEYQPDAVYNLIHDKFSEEIIYKE